MSNNIKVSVICLVYNHEPYLRKCLDGFVNQKCNFEYEVLIHDDASTDNSASIIREYEKKYPNIIKPIYQKENQYSKGVKISTTYLYPRAQGEYLAWCEGDDYWTDENKLQKQVDFLDENRDFSACVHCTIKNHIKEKRISIFPQINVDREFSADEIIKEGGGVFSTNSLMLRRSIKNNMPSCFLAKGFGDYQMFIYAAFSGRVWCFKENMSVYNYQVENSWSDRQSKNQEKQKEHLIILKDMLQRVDEHYNCKYHNAIDYKIKEIEFTMLTMSGDKDAMKQKQYRQHYKKYKKRQLIEAIKIKFPFLLKLKNKLIKKRMGEG